MWPQSNSKPSIVLTVLVQWSKTMAHNVGIARHTIIWIAGKKMVDVVNLVVKLDLPRTPEIQKDKFKYESTFAST
jgi:hypothetical protein